MEVGHCLRIIIAGPTTQSVASQPHDVATRVRPICPRGRPRIIATKHLTVLLQRLIPSLADTWEQGSCVRFAPPPSGGRTCRRFVFVVRRSSPNYRPCLDCCSIMSYLREMLLAAMNLARALMLGWASPPFLAKFLRVRSTPVVMNRCCSERNNATWTLLWSLSMHHAMAEMSSRWWEYTPKP